MRISFMKQLSLKRHGIRNVTASHWHLPAAVHSGQINSRGKTFPKKCC